MYYKTTFFSFKQCVFSNFWEYQEHPLSIINVPQRHTTTKPRKEKKGTTLKNKYLFNHPTKTDAIPTAIAPCAFRTKITKHKVEKYTKGYRALSQYMLSSSWPDFPQTIFC